MVPDTWKKYLGKIKMFNKSHGAVKWIYVSLPVNYLYMGDKIALLLEISSPSHDKHRKKLSKITKN